MIYLFIKSFMDLLLIVGGISLLFLFVGIYLIFRPSKTVSQDKAEPQMLAKQRQEAPKASPSFQETYASIAGDDVAVTKLDLARAFIESGQGGAAKDLLTQVIQNGSDGQRQEAQQLLSRV